jgi:hypothetical protein
LISSSLRQPARVDPVEDPVYLRASSRLRTLSFTRSFSLLPVETPFRASAPRIRHHGCITTSRAGQFCPAASSSRHAGDSGERPQRTGLCQAPRARLETFQQRDRLLSWCVQLEPDADGWIWRQASAPGQRALDQHAGHGPAAAPQPERPPDARHRF